MIKFWNHFILGFKRDGFSWLETTIVAYISLYIWTLSDYLNSASTEYTFFWPLFGPLLISLRYGFSKGFICVLLTTAGLACIMSVTGELDHYPLSLAIGLILMSMISGEFHDYWHRINQKHILDHEHVTSRLNSFTLNYHLLKISHDQLEQRTAGQSISLRASINNLQKIASKYSSHRLEHLGNPLLNLLSEIGGLEVAGIYKVTEGKVQTSAYAIMGDHHDLDLNDPMLQDMLKSHKLLSPAKLDTNTVHNSRYQLCIPLSDTHKHLQGFIVAESAKFFMLTPTNIALLSLVSNYTADLLSDSIVTPILQPHQSDTFLRYLERAQYNKRHYGSDTCLVACIDTRGYYKQYLDDFINYRRGADIYWSCQTKIGQPALVVLLPMTTIREAHMYIQRFRKQLNEKHSYINDYMDIIGPLSLDKDINQIQSLLKEFGAYNENLAVYSDSFV